MRIRYDQMKEPYSNYFNLPNLLCIMVLLLFAAVTGQNSKKGNITKRQSPEKIQQALQEKGKGVAVKRPGEIIFYTGAVIEGHIEKPQVVIVFPKEKPRIDSITFDKSFRKEMLAPIDINVIGSIREK